MRMSRDLEGTEVSPVIRGELYDSVGRYSKSLMAPSDYRANKVFNFWTKNRSAFEPCMALKKKTYMVCEFIFNCQKKDIYGL
ncbi:unnamed protein product [Staurois parvus]|uniref:Uncharacterized protein n=1 Tax=Staurois parvus TaxID=386267 RepID=A0ABN9EVQ9_9NEOB|nr:unnamed protein product [Staurois parvus]